MVVLSSKNYALFVFVCCLGLATSGEDMQNSDRSSMGWFFANSPLGHSGNGDSEHATGTPNSDQFRCDCKIIIVERSVFLRDCISRSLGGFGLGEPTSFVSLAELLDYPPPHEPTVVIWSILSLSAEETDSEFALLSAIDPSLKIMVFAQTDDRNTALAVLSQGAIGYISMEASFEFIIQALRLVSAGGVVILTQSWSSIRQALKATCAPAWSGAITCREAEVIQAIRQGKSNRAIANELKMCESTVKVHVRNIMNKLHARNRTEVAIVGESKTNPASRNLAGKRNSN